MNISHFGEKGFTLVEIIVTLVIAALLGAVIFAYMGTSLTRSHEPIAMVEDLGKAVADMDEIVAYYNNRYLAKYVNWGNTSSPGTFCHWIDQKEASDGCSISRRNVKGESNLSDDFDILEVTITCGKQSLSALFSE